MEVAFRPDGWIAVCDTKDRAVPPHHHTSAGWDAFVAGVRSGAFDRR